MLEEIELAWAAGFYDGEGHFSCWHYSGGVNTQFSVSQNQLALLERFQIAVGGLGQIYKKPTSYDFRITNWADAMACLSLLWPYLSEVKKTQARDAVSKRNVIRSSAKRASPSDVIDTSFMEAA